MSKFTKVSTSFEGLYVIEPTVVSDERGFFSEVYNKRDFREIGIDVTFVQENQSRSQEGVLRGMHYQVEHPQIKLVRVARGSVYDVVVDIRLKSKTFGQYYGLNLSSKNMKMLFVPEGFAHGFLTMNETVDLLYSVSDYYYPEFDRGIIWNDPDIGINWPLSKIGMTQPILSPKDSTLPRLCDLDE